MKTKAIESELIEVLNSPLVCINNMVYTNMQSINYFQWVDLNKVLSKHRTKIINISVSQDHTINLQIISTR